MSYVVLARKYRPQSFAELVGQQHIVRTLGNAITMDRVHHAFVFTGARGVGKTSTARLLARGLNCSDGPTLTPCGSCTSCSDIARGSSQDVLEIDGASHTGVDHVRALRETVRYLPASGRFKLYIIDEVHMLSTAAFNALLKTLEEPPAHVKFILATTEPHKIPVTILSRAQRLDFRRVSMTTLIDHLADVARRENLEFDPGAFGIIARQSQGSVRDALSLLDQVVSYAGPKANEDEVGQALGTIGSTLLFDLAESIARAQADGALKAVVQAEDMGHDLAMVAHLLAEHIHDLALVKSLKEPQAHLHHLTKDELQQLHTQGALRSHSDWQRLFLLAQDIAQDVGRSMMPKVTFEMGLLRMMLVAPTTDLTSLLVRLDDLLAATPANQTPQASSAPTPASSRQTSDASSPHPSEDAPNSRTQPPPAAATEPLATHPPLRHVDATPKRAAVPETASRPHSEAAEAWRSFVERMRQQRPALGSVLERGQLVAFTENSIQVAFERQTFWWDAANDKDNRTLMHDVLTELMGHDMHLQVIDLKQVEGCGETLADERERHSREGWLATQAAALEHETIRAATHILGGEVREIRPPERPQADAAP